MLPHLNTLHRVQVEHGPEVGFLEVAVVEGLFVDA
jgi:hypothetical protein